MPPCLVASLNADVLMDPLHIVTILDAATTKKLEALPGTEARAQSALYY